MADSPAQKIIVINRKARFEFTVLQSYEAGIVLVGTEVKSLRQGKVNITDSYAEIRNGEVWLINLHINIYEQGNRFNHDPVRRRKLLLNKNEIRKIKKGIDEKGQTLIPLKLYFSKGKVKVEIALAKGKKIYDKREDIAKKDQKRDQERKF